MLLGSTEKSFFYGAILYAICFFRVFSFSFRVFVIQSDQQNNSIMLLIARNVS